MHNARESKGRTATYIDLGQWELEIVSDVPEITSGMAELFGYRAADEPSLPGAIRLTCDVVDDVDEFRRLEEKLVFTGEPIVVGNYVSLRYSGHDADKITLLVDKTALMQLERNSPAYCKVLLSPDRVQPPPSEDGRRQKPRPEAFLYPLMCEWMRSYDACMIHCGAVVLGGKAVVLIGPPGSGKSSHVLRMIKRGAGFLADDLAIIRRAEDGRTLLCSFREVADVHRESLDRFPELEMIRSCPLRNESKYSVDINRQFGVRAEREAETGAIIRLRPGDEQQIVDLPMDRYLESVDRMAFRVTDPQRSEEHFWLLVDWLLATRQYEATQGIMSAQLDEIMSKLNTGADLVGGA